MRSGPRRYGPDLPYRLLGGVVPCPGGWLACVGKLQGITLYPDEIVVHTTFVDVIDRRPSLDIAALHVPVGLPSKPTKGGRTCDREARALLGWPRSGAVQSAPCRPALAAESYADAAARNEGMSAVQWRQLHRIAEAAEELQPYRQRTIFEIHPELCFHQLNGDQTLRYGKHTQAGREEREVLLLARLQGIDRLLDTELAGCRREHRVDAAAALWTARRIAARSVIRIPQDPEWDDDGLRMEYVR